MRFDTIDAFHIDDLHLDEGNYRFRKAEDQQACIEKIYRSNPSNFGNLMASIAEEDLGELLLVYKKKKEFIVLDGNRRAAAIKVLANPTLAPTTALQRKAEKLLEKSDFDFGKIQAQVSDSQEKIYQTVYERHASGNGSRRLNWSAIAAARFRYDQQIHDDNTYWHSTALIFALEADNNAISEFIDSKNYSHETFTRIVRGAMGKGVIPKRIFNEKEMRLKKTPKYLVSDALKKAQHFLNSIESKELSLSRKGDSYADKEKLDAYLNQFKTPDSVEEGKGAEQQGGKATQAQQSNNPAQGNGGGTATPPTPPSKIKVSEQVNVVLGKLNSQKLAQLYYSLTTIPLKTHASLMCVGAWAFFEVLATLVGKKANDGLDSYIKGKINEWFADKGERAELRSSITYIIDEGNVNKHSGITHSFDARHLSVHFDALEPLIIKMMEEAAKKKPKK